jgi:hypothetical protein
MPDHIHMLVESPPTYSPTTIVRIFKSISLKKLREEFLPQIKQHIWKDGTLWATGYYVVSVSDGATSDVVAEYIRTQWQRPDCIDLCFPAVYTRFVKSGIIYLKMTALQLVHKDKGLIKAFQLYKKRYLSVRKMPNITKLLPKDLYSTMRLEGEKITHKQAQALFK